LPGGSLALTICARIRARISSSFIRAYDPLNRRVSTAYANGSVHASQFDVFDNRYVYTDANGSVVEATFDLLNRLTGRDITTGPGVLGTTAEEYEYDGAGRLVYARNVDSNGTIAEVDLAYDRMANLIGEGQTIRDDASAWETQSWFDSSGNRFKIEHTDSTHWGSPIHYDYDTANRLTKIRRGTSSTLMEYKYQGPERVVKRRTVNCAGKDLWLEYTYTTVGLPQSVTSTFDPTGTPTILDRRTYAWDANYNKVLQVIDEPFGQTRNRHNHPPRPTPALPGLWK
jgi:hypothetical protein